MLSVVIIFYDRDYGNVPNLMRQIEEFVKVEHEVILISNCENVDALGFKPTFSFGRNVKILKARKKAFELAKGDYLWYVDGDDRILDCLDMEFTEDMHVFGRRNVSGDDLVYEEKTWREKDFMKFHFLNFFQMGLWNKVIRKTLLENFMDAMDADDVIAMEDISVVIGCLKYARSVKTEKKILYQHLLGYSNREFADVETLRVITLGHERSMENILMLAEDTAFEVEMLVDDHLRFYLDKIDFAGMDIPTVVRLLDIALPLFQGYEGLVSAYFFASVVGQIDSKKRYEAIAAAFKRHFLEENFLKVKRIQKELVPDGDGNLTEVEGEFWCDPIYFGEGSEDGE